MQKLVYSFNEGSKDMKNLLGDKGANLSEMTKMGLRVPFGFIVTTEACSAYHAEGKKLSEDLITEIEYQMEVLENVAGKKFGDRENPLLVSVRSSTDISIPGMLSTILNLGLNDEIVEGLAELTDNPRFAYDSYRRFIQSYGVVVLGVPKIYFDEIFTKKKVEVGVVDDVELTEDSLKEIVNAYKALVIDYTGHPFPQEPGVQLISAIEAIFCCWNQMKSSADLGTAVTVQTMVFGNMGENSGTGVAFSRNPSNGMRELFGEFLVNAQGEDIVAGIRTPNHIAEMEVHFPEVYKDFQRIATVLETHFKDMQDMEFTVENNKLYMLQTRVAKRTAECAVRVAVDMVEEGLISKENAVERIDPNQIDQLLHPAFEREAEERAKILEKGLPASPGAASGRIFFQIDDALRASEQGTKVILVRPETAPEDLAGIAAAEGILTARGGMTSHAAVAARGMGKCCIVGCEAVLINLEEKTLSIGGMTLCEGDSISLNGTLGHVYFGEVKNRETAFSEEFNQLMTWADEIRMLKIRTNADSPEEAMKALAFGAEGIGLCRTEHMFFEEDRLPLIRQMIMTQDETVRRGALERLLSHQKADFKEIYEVMGDKPVTIRLLDPPLHEFLPTTDEEMAELREALGVSEEMLQKRAKDLQEFNPMLGHRGCRLAVTYPEIAEMQTRAMIEAAIEVSREKNIEIIPEIMIPLVGVAKELAEVKAVVVRTIEQCQAAYEAELDYFIGTMIEVPRAALTAGEIAKEADFFSFGTNDLTQMTYGFSRDDTGNLIKDYVEKGILEDDPFQTIDREGVGMLMETAVKKGKQARANLKIGICGEHGGDPRSIEFCHQIGLHYVSCSPFRVPVARIAAAQAAIQKSDRL